MRHLRAMGASIRKLATEFGTSQWMVARLINNSAQADDVSVNQ